MKKFLFLLTVLVAVLGAAPAGAQTPRDITFFMTFVPNVQFAPVYVALANGDFAAAGLNVTVEHSFDEALGVDRIAANDLQFGLISGEQVILAAAKGRPVVYVYAWFQQYPVGIVTPTSSGIESIADLRGRRVGIPVASGASYSGLTALLGAHDLTLSDIRLETIGFIAPEAICTGIVDGAVVYINNEPLQIRLRAQQGDCGDVSDVRVFPVADVAQMVSNGVVTNAQTLADDPALVRAMVGAFDAGLRGVINNPAAAFLASADYVEGLLTDDALRAALEAEAEAQAGFLAGAPDRLAVAASRDALRGRLGEQFDDAALLQFDVLLASIALWDADVPGFSAPAAWDGMQTTLLAITDPALGTPLLAAPLDLSTLFSNDFVPGVPDATPAP